MKEQGVFLQGLMKSHPVKCCCLKLAISDTYLTLVPSNSMHQSKKSKRRLAKKASWKSLYDIGEKRIHRHKTLFLLEEIHIDHWRKHVKSIVSLAHSQKHWVISCGRKSLHFLWLFLTWMLGQLQREIAILIKKVQFYVKYFQDSFNLYWGRLQICCGCVGM